MLGALERLVLAESPSLDKALCDACAQAVASLFRERLHIQPMVHRRAHAGDHLEFRVGPASGKTLLILCHHDTVWAQGSLQRLPFLVDGDRVSGPGCYDMKAGIVETVFALEQASPKRPVIILSTSDEEVGSRSSRDLIEERAKDAEAVLVLEPAASGGALKTARKGVADFLIRVEGRAAHAGVEPEKGVSATLELAAQIMAVRDLADPAAGTTINVGLVRGGTRRNVVAATAEAEVDVRFRTAAEATRIEGALRGLRPTVPGARVQVEGGIDRPPMERSEGVVRLMELARRIAAGLGAQLTEASTGGGSDGNFTAALGVPTLDGLGPDGGGAHADSEHLLVSSWRFRTQLLSQLISAL